MRMIERPKDAAELEQFMHLNKLSTRRLTALTKLTSRQINRLRSGENTLPPATAMLITLATEKWGRSLSEAESDSTEEWRHFVDAREYVAYKWAAMTNDQRRAAADANKAEWEQQQATWEENNAERAARQARFDAAPLVDLAEGWTRLKRQPNMGAGSVIDTLTNPAGRTDEYWFDIKTGQYADYCAADDRFTEREMEEGKDNYNQPVFYTQAQWDAMSEADRDEWTNEEKDRARRQKSEHL